MGWFDNIFNSNSQQPAPKAAFPTVPNADDEMQRQAWLQNFIKSQSDAAGARNLSQRGLLNFFTGNDRTAAGEAAAAAGPAEYFKMLSADPAFRTAQAGGQNAQIGALQNQALAGVQSGQTVDPNNIPALLAPYTAAMRASFPELGPQSAAPQQGATPPPPPQQQPQQGMTSFAPSAQPPVTAAPLAPPQGTPTGADMSSLFTRLGNATASMPTPSVAPNAAPAGAPLAAPTAGAPTPAASALQKHRALLDLYGRLDLFRGNAAGAKALFDEAARGAPTGSAVVNGNAVEGVTGAPIGTTGGQFEAGNAGLKEAAVKNAGVAPQQAIDNNKIGGEFAAKIGETNNEKEQTPITGYSTTTGEPMVAPASALKGGLPGFAPGTNPYVERHAEEAKTLNTSAGEARDGIIKAKQLVEAARNLKTGAWGNDIQDIRRGLVSMGLGGEALANAATEGDVTKELSTELAGLQSRAIAGGRTPLGLFTVVHAVKPGLLSVDPEAVAAPIIAGFQRKVDEADFANHYYSDPKNWNKMDAREAFASANPDQKYIDAAKPQPRNAPGVRNDAEHARIPKGTRYTDPNGNVRIKQ